MQKFTMIVGLALWGCGGDSTHEPVEPDVESFELDPSTQAEVEAAAQDGEGAEATYTYDASSSTMRLSISRSTFSCDIEAASEIVANTTALSATEMSWRFPADGGTANWTRLSEGGTDVVGVWKSAEPLIYLVLAADGSAQLFGPTPTCNQDRARNGEQCYEVTPATMNVVLDGDASEWQSVDAAARLVDDAGDQQGDDTGADILGLRVAVSQGDLYVYTQLASAPSTAFQAREAPQGGAYRLTVRTSDGMTYEESLAYRPETAEWSTLIGQTGIEAAVTDQGIEWHVGLDLNLDEVSLILFRPTDCSSRACVFLDDMACAFFRP